MRSKSETPPWVCLLRWVVLGLAFAPAAVAEEWTFQALGDLPGGASRSGALSVSPDGGTVVGFGTSAESGIEAFRWSAGGGLQGIGSLAGGAFDSDAFDASGIGAFIVGSSSSQTSGVNSREAFLWSADTESMTGLGDLAGGGTRSAAYAIAPDGSMVVGSSSSSTTGGGFDQAFRWSEGEGMVALPFLPGAAHNSEAYGVSTDGAVIVGATASTFSGANRTESVRWTASGGIQGLGDLPGGQYNGWANAVSGDGLVIVGASSSEASGSNDVEAFRWTSTTGFGALGDLPGGSYSSEALAASADGDWIVGKSEGVDSSTAFLWDADSGLRAVSDILEQDGVDMTGWQLTAATGISAGGSVICGTGINPQSFEEAWVAILVPEPGAFLLGVAALLTLVLCGPRPHRSRA